jgi:hypothetical protein
MMIESDVPFPLSVGEGKEKMHPAKKLSLKGVRSAAPEVRKNYFDTCRLLLNITSDFIHKFVKNFSFK